jgi:hypothetical protein
MYPASDWSVLCSGPPWISARVRRAGEITEMTVMLPVNAISALPRHAEMEARVLELARAGVDDAEIARQLTAEGHRSPSSAEVLPTTVQNPSAASA